MKDKNWLPADEFRTRLFDTLDAIETLIAGNTEHIDAECRKAIQQFRRKLGAPEAMKAAVDSTQRGPK